MGVTWFKCKCSKVRLQVSFLEDLSIYVFDAMHLNEKATYMSTEPREADVLAVLLGVMGGDCEFYSR